MTPEQIKAIQSSFAKVAPISEQAAELFYGRLFEIAPAVKPLFHGDMKEQGKKLMGTLAVVVNGLSNLEAVLPAASALAKKHVHLRRKGRRLRACRRSVTVDTGKGVGRRVDARSRRCVDGGLHHVVGLYDR